MGIVKKLFLLNFAFCMLILGIVFFFLITFFEANYIRSREEMLRGEAEFFAEQYVAYEGDLSRMGQLAEELFLDRQISLGVLDRFGRLQMDDDSQLVVRFNQFELLGNTDITLNFDSIRPTATVEVQVLRELAETFQSDEFFDGLVGESFSILAFTDEHLNLVPIEFSAVAGNDPFSWEQDNLATLALYLERFRMIRGSGEILELRRGDIPFTNRPLVVEIWDSLDFVSQFSEINRGERELTELNLDVMGGHYQVILEEDSRFR